MVVTLDIQKRKQTRPGVCLLQVGRHPSDRKGDSFVNGSHEERIVKINIRALLGILRALVESFEHSLVICDIFHNRHGLN